MGVLDINREPQRGLTPIAGVPPSFFVNADEILTRLDGYGCYIQRNGNHWTIVIDREAGYQEHDIYRDAVRLEYDSSASLVNVTTPAAFKIAVGTAYVTVGAGTASLSTAYNAVSTSTNRFYWVKLASTGGAFTGTLEKGSSFPVAAGDQNVVTPTVNAYVRLWEVLVSATKVTRILQYTSPLSTFS